MFVTCDKCGKHYDDAKRWTICPHPSLDEAPPLLVPLPPDCGAEAKVGACVTCRGDGNEFFVGVIRISNAKFPTHVIASGPGWNKQLAARDRGKTWVVTKAVPTYRETLEQGLERCRVARAKLRAARKALNESAINSINNYRRSVEHQAAVFEFAEAALGMELLEEFECLQQYVDARDRMGLSPAEAGDLAYPVEQGKSNDVENTSPTPNKLSTGECAACNGYGCSQCNYTGFVD